MNTFSALFLLALTIATGTRLWLASRHIGFIRSHRNAVPGEFATQITLEAHQKAADYSTLRSRFGMIHTLLDAAVLLLLTFGGLLQIFDSWAAHWFNSDILRGTAFIGLFMVFSALVDLPFSYYRTFSI